MTYNVSQSNTESLDQVCTLIKTVTDKTDKIGNPIKAVLKTEVFCSVTSVGGNEKNRASKQGINAELVLLTDSESYNGENLVIYENAEYDIYRTFRKNNGLTELYLAERGNPR